MSKEQKKQLRNTVLQKRDSMTPHEIQAAEKSIMDNILTLNQFIAAQNVFCYLSFRSEVPTQSMINYCTQQGKHVYIPACITETKEMVISQYDNNVKLIPSNYGVPEPSRDTIKLADRNLLDIAVVPGAVFDARGYRVGYGAGYYDKFFAHCRKKIFKIAAAYSFQVVDRVPEDDFDVPVDCIVTEQGIIICSKE